VGELERLLVFRQPLSPDLWLVVGDDVGRLRQLGDDFLRVFSIGLLLALTLAAGGGAAVSLTFLKRIDSITRTAEAIIEGDIGQRISLRGSGDDLDRLANTLNRMLDRIGLLMETLRHVSTDIAHDLRTPLSHLRHALDDARERASDIGEYKAAVERAVNETDAILETFSAILRIAQIESGSRRAGFRRINLSGIVSDVAQTFAPTAEEQGHALVPEIEKDLQIVGDRELITQLTANLIDNAIRHTPSGAKIWLRLSTKNDAVFLEVCDNGIGVPPSERDKIFNRFYRGEASRTTPGNGLGLSLVSAVASLHWATIAVLDNEPGLKVQVEFPRGVSSV
jgi:signal transduction histidine kinase